MVWTGPKNFELNQNFLNGSQKSTWCMSFLFQPEIRKFQVSPPKLDQFKTILDLWNIILEESKIILDKKYFSQLSEKITYF